MKYLPDEGGNYRGFLMRFGTFDGKQMTYVNNARFNKDFSFLARAGKTKKLFTTFEHGLDDFFNADWPEGDQTIPGIQIGRV